MLASSFTLDTPALLALFCFLVLSRALRGRRPSPSLPFPDPSRLLAFQTGWRVRLAFSPSLFLRLSLLFFLAALVDPRFLDSSREESLQREFQALQPPPKEGLAFYLLLDHSSSMEQKVVDETGGGVAFVSKLDLLKRITEDFLFGSERLGLPGRGSDAAGLAVFARVPEILVPLTLDKEALKRGLKDLKTIEERSRDGTAIGYAIYKTASVIEATREFATREKSGYEIREAAIILVTDGFQFPHPEDQGNRLRTMGIEEAASFAKENQIKLYIVSVDPQIEQASYEPRRALLKRAAESSGGRFYAAAEPQKLQEIYREIDLLEKSSLPSELKGLGYIEIRKLSLYKPLIGLGLSSLILAIFLNCFIFRRVP